MENMGDYMDRQNLVEGLQKAFQMSGESDAAKKNQDVEYKENTNTLLVKEQRTYSMLKEPEKKQMSEEELFDRLLKERRQ